MLIQLLGIFLFGLGLFYAPVPSKVLGVGTINQLVAAITPAINPTASPTGVNNGGNSITEAHGSSLTPAQISAYISDSWNGERMNATISAGRGQAMRQTFMDKIQQRDQKDAVAQSKFFTVVYAFPDKQKMDTVFALGKEYHAVILNALSSIEYQSESLLVLLDDISAVAKALQNQGLDISRVQSDMLPAQAKISSVVTLNGTLVENISKVIPVTDQASAGSQIIAAITDTKAQFVPVNNAILDAYASVGIVLTDLESLSKPLIPYE